MRGQAMDTILSIHQDYLLQARKRNDAVPAYHTWLPNCMDMAWSLKSKTHASAGLPNWARRYYSLC